MAHRVLAIVLCAMLVFSAGCAGWGTDGPADPEADDNSEGDGNTTAPPSNESDDGNASDDSDNATDDPNTTATDSDGEPPDDSDSDDSSSDSDSDDSSSSDAEPADSSSADESDESDDSGENADLDGGSSDATPGGSTDGPASQEPESGDSDESTDETGQTGDGDSQPDDSDENETDTGDENESDSDEDDAVDTGTATGVIHVVDQDGEPIEGEPVTITPPATVTERGKYVEYTDENGVVVIGLAAGEPTDVVSYTAEVRGEEQRMGIMSDEHAGVQEVVFEPTDRMYHFKTVVTVVDEDGDPVEGEPVEARHGLLGDDPANEWEVVGETDAHGEVVLVGTSSERSDVISREVRVREQTITTSLESDRRTEQIQIDTSENENETGDENETGAPNETNESAQNETVAAAVA